MKNAGDKVETDFLEFECMGRTVSDKTIGVEVRSKTASTVLGRIGWYAPWRRYAFSPQTDTLVFDAVCLKAIANFVEYLMVEHKKQGKGKAI